MAITYFIGIDRDDDGSFTETGQDISADVLQAEWRLGMSRPYDSVASIAQATIIVRNTSQAYSPEITDDIIGKPIIIQSDDGTTARTHFTGFVHTVLPQAGDNGSHQAQIIAYDRMIDLTRQEIRSPLLVNVCTEEAIGMLLDQIQWRYTILDGYCIIGRDSIGSSDIFSDDALVRVFETGKSIFGYTGDDWGDGIPAYDAIQQLADGETGRFFFNRDGDAVFYNRHHLLVNNTIAATFTDDMAGLDYKFGEITNHIEATLTQRTSGTPASTLWSLESPVLLRAGRTLQIVASYNYDDVPVGAVDLVLPLRQYTHYTATTVSGSSPQDRTDNVYVALVEQSLSAAVLEIRNNSGEDLYLTTLEVKGTPLIIQDTVTIHEQERASISLYGKHGRNYDLPSIATVEDAAGLVAWELQRHTYPGGVVRELQTNTRNHPQQTLTLTLFDLIQIQETQIGHDSPYAIVAEHHLVDRGGTRHQVQWLLEPAEIDSFFVIGTHSIGDMTVSITPRYTNHEIKKPV